ncbi:TlpA family protein disulfide reductase [Aureitalea marina]|uniref:Thiol-disulfide oxidoreductase n=1 Tax=Aureitalea marina TaxID=930804 RepID=A0A2S7KMY1_9FLAO|nr:TlpA disulfide reductase family protein [Aureitalea marina]PQB03958.1 thiol-disulfide oxidoreductase [Aureitalea marina]
MVKFLKKNYGNILILAFLALLIFPQTGTPIKVFFNRLISFSPSILSEEDRTRLEDYNWVLRDMEGNLVNLDRSRERVVIINFWGTWCPPCIAEMPSLQELYNDYGTQVDFYLVSAEDLSLIDRFMESREFEMPAFQLRSVPPDNLSYKSLPTTYLLDKQGQIVIRKTGAANWNSKSTRELLDQLLMD